MLKKLFPTEITIAYPIIYKCQVWEWEAGSSPEESVSVERQLNLEAQLTDYFPG